MVHRWLGRDDDDRRLAGHLPSFWCEARTVTGPFDDDLMRRVGETVQCAVAEDRIIEQAEPFVDAAVGGDDEARPTMPLDASAHL